MIQLFLCHVTQRDDYLHMYMITEKEVTENFVLVRHQESFKCLLLCEITVTKLSDWYSMVLINLPEL